MPDVGDAGFDLALIIVKSHAYNIIGDDGEKLTSSKGSRFSGQIREGRSGLEGYLIDIDMLEIYGILGRLLIADHILCL